MSRDLTDALSKLFLKLGGKTSDSKENKGPVDYIDDITDIVEPSGGGIEFFDVIYTKASESDDASINKTFEELVAAHKANKIIRLNIGDTKQYIDDVTFSNISMICISMDSEIFKFVGESYGISSDNKYSISISIDLYVGIVQNIESI